MLSATAIEAEIGGTIFAGRVVVHDVLESTIDTCRALADAGEPEGAVVACQEQRAGRGQRGNRWFSPRGGALYVSVLLRPPLAACDVGRLTVIAGLAACEAVRDVGVPARIKRPNDVLASTAAGWRKLGGVLVDTAVQGAEVRHAIVSLGLNVSVPSEAFPAELHDVATSIIDVAGRHVEVATAAGAFLRRLSAMRASMERGERDAWFAPLAERHADLVLDAVVALGSSG